MKALTFPQYGNFEVLKVKDYKIPKVRQDEYLVKVHSSSLTTAESMMRRGNPFFVRFFLGLFKPRHNISGACFSGTVIQEGYDKFSPHEQFNIFGETGAALGSNADYIKVKKNLAILPKPDYISFEQAACLCDGTLTSYYFINKRMETRHGESILILGATGSLGLAAVQLVKLKGLRVTAVCSEKNFEIVKQLGADKVISYQDKDYLEKIGQFNFIFDCVGKIPLKKLKKFLFKNGQYYSPVISIKLLRRQLMNKLHNEKAYFVAVGMLPPKELRGYLREILDMIKKGDLDIPIAKEFHFSNVIEAHKIIDSGHKVGNFVLSHTD